MSKKPTRAELLIENEQLRQRIAGFEQFMPWLNQQNQSQNKEIDRLRDVIGLPKRSRLKASNE